MNTMNVTSIERAQRGLARVWIDFESALVQVPIIARLTHGTLRIEDYCSLLLNLRQQVVEGSRWIGRAASNLGPQNEKLRSLFVKHTAAEHRDFLLLERDFAAAGGDPALMAVTPKNVGSEALSAFMYYTASRPDPLGMLGAMFIIEGLGHRLAEPWAKAIQNQLSLGEDAVRFLRYHGEGDDAHMQMFDDALALAVTNDAIADDLVRHAKIVARLYRLQLEELDNV